MAFLKLKIVSAIRKSLPLFALLINTNIEQQISDSIAGIGGVLLIGVGINLLGLKKIPVGNYMLSLFLPFLLAF